MHLYKQLLVLIIAEANSVTQEDFQYIQQTLWNYSKEYAIIHPYVYLEPSQELVTEEPADYIVTFTRVDGKLTHELKPYETSNPIAGNSNNNV